MLTKLESKPTTHTTKRKPFIITLAMLQDAVVRREARRTELENENGGENERR